MRWRHPHLGMLLPASTFIPIAEKSGLMISDGRPGPFGKPAHKEAPPGWRSSIGVAVNLSVSQFDRGAILPGRIQHALDASESGAGPARDRDHRESALLKSEARAARDAKAVA